MQKTAWSGQNPCSGDKTLIPFASTLLVLLVSVGWASLTAQHFITTYQDIILDYQALAMYRRRLPHWRISGSVYFVTWRLWPSQSALTGEERSAVVSALRYFAGVRYDLYAYVVMDDHVHALLSPRDWSLQGIVHSWKSFSANQLQRCFCRSGRIWQDEFFDRIVRNEEELLQKTNYILGNPFSRWRDILEYEWVGLGPEVEPAL